MALKLGSDLTLLVSRGDEQRIQLTPNLPESVPAPVSEGQTVGGVTVSLDGRTLAEVPVIAAENVEAKGLNAGIRWLWENWMAVGG